MFAKRRRIWSECQRYLPSHSSRRCQSSDATRPNIAQAGEPSFVQRLEHEYAKGRIKNVMRPLGYFINLIASSLSLQDRIKPSAIYRKFGWPGTPRSDLFLIHPDHDKMMGSVARQIPMKRDALESHYRIAQNPDVLRIYTDASSRWGFVSIGTAAPTVNVVRTQVLGRNRSPGEFYIHPVWTGSDYMWTIQAGELYAIIQGLELAIEHAKFGDTIYVFTDGYGVFTARYWHSALLYSQLRQLHQLLCRIEDKIRSSNLSVFLHWIPDYINNASLGGDHAVAHDANYAIDAVNLYAEAFSQWLAAQWMSP